MSRSRPVRADAARNREKLVAAAAQVFGDRGLDAPLEEVARRAGVSIGTLYNHFHERQDLFDAIFPARLAELDRLAAAALEDPDPWAGFAAFVEGIVALQAQDRGLNDVLARRFPLASELAEACDRGFAHLARIVERAKESGQLRSDFEVTDFVPLMWAMSQIIRESGGAEPAVWRRFLGLFLDGLRADAARPLPVPALSGDQMAELMRGR
ncbi:TetR/AcrR family transcriptional regulator [Actinomadura verrucosospora]|uniref:TetR/AcrR family transcriptional regulator n=1 Tax=Actinomadura verrucosospora TaxID=46165 RepID=UPI00156528F6|nr:TetR/AcrR family transcriptional regulator [Actinomadura verrucosospora]